MASETTEYVARMTKLIENVQYRLRLVELLWKSDSDLSDCLQRQDLNSIGSRRQKAERLFRFELRGMSAPDVPWWPEHDEAREAARATSCRAPTFLFGEEILQEEVEKMVDVLEVSLAVQRQQLRQWRH